MFYGLRIIRSRDVKSEYVEVLEKKSDMGKLRFLFLLVAVLFACNGIDAQTYVKSTDGDVVFTISSSNKFYIGKGYDEYAAQIKGDVLEIDGTSKETVFKNGILYFEGEPMMKTVNGKTYIYDEDNTMVSDPICVRKDTKVYDEDGELVFTVTQAISDKIQTTIIFFLLVLASAYD